MNPAHDILLPGPLPGWLLRVLLFGVFELHLAFALLTLGVTILASIELLTDRPTMRSLRTFSTQKSLAVVIGVGVLILMLVFEPVPMLRGINRVAPGWLVLVLVLLLSLVSIEFSTQLQRQPRLQRVLLVVGTLLLLAVPAIFSSMVVSVENPEVWVSSGRSPPPWPGRLTTHYLLRLAHVLGAAVVFSAGLLLLWGRPPPSHAARLRRWMETALWFQVIIGLGLLLWLPHAPSTAAGGILLAAVTMAAVVAKRLAARNQEFVRREQRVQMAGLLLLLLTGMLLVRQALQDQVLMPLNRDLQAEARRYSAVLAQAERQTPPRRLSAMPVRSKPDVIYMESCMFCHGTVGNGLGDEAPRLAIAPEDLTAVRSSREYLYQILRTGVPGTAMPTFSYYTSEELDQVIGYLHQLGLRDEPEALPELVPAPMPQVADEIFSRICADCHGPDGRGNGPLARSLSPKPPDFHRYSVAPARAVRVMTWGYRGTAMPAFLTFPEPLRWALAAKVNRLYEAKSGAGPK